MTVYIDGQYSSGTVWHRERHSEASGSKTDVDRAWEGTRISTREVMYHFAALETRQNLKTSSLSDIAGRLRGYYKCGQSEGHDLTVRPIGGTASDDSTKDESRQHRTSK
jgi:hypothetical protein